ncbi:peptidylprolyl isomerase [Rahnella aquatilis]|uniref:Periplasmic chaperone PpiD n=1 Tax=Rahnella aquatilis (strain ATCC 33071 / DSM 4594 / JCM 1683 / NBRC 105701 / NCIMB 13365 / CIP 78.65) TaxID=745277 RepID=H2IZI3_RAHAC|nr:peptidylprolyl isomerase [Rahnella aquatilis]AEX53226.1 parvulin-like peptidyl-prolyl isomerase [Rahnella aquatilis CIP 78.65 = ATCC 33071]KFD04105.1 peptidyl-prolyl cis-trans isomerase [Rahnella aquatilis CIP 78.65 = ATCC 33071]
MMDNLRAAANHVVLKIILALIILSFILTGVGNYLIGGSGDYAAKVNGQEIGRAQLEQAVQNQRSRLQQQLGDQFSALAGSDGYMQQLRQESLSNLIDVTLLDQYSKKLGITVSDQQIKDAIFATPQFQTDGRFDNTKYLQSIQGMGYTADNFAQLMKQQLISQQLEQAYGQSDFVLPVESKSLGELILQSRDVQTATLDTDALAAKQQVTDAELQAFYDQNKNNFLSPEQVKVSYIEMDAAAMQGKTNVTDADISAYYDQHKSEFGQPERRRYSVIVLKSQADADAVAAELKKGADFVELAKTKSTDALSARQGGDLGWMEPETTLPEFKNANLTTKGQVSGVIKSDSGFFILRLDDVTPEQVKPLAEVRNTISDKLKQEKSLDAYYALQQKVSEAATNDNESLASAEDVAGTKAIHTDWFTQNQIPAGINFKPVVQAIFDGGLIGQDGSPGSNSDIITVDGDRAFVVRVDAHKAEGVKPFAEVKDQVTTLVKRQKAQDQARVDGEKLLTALKEGKGDDAMKAAGLTFGSVQKVQRSQQPSAFEENVYALPHPQKDKPVYGLTQDDKGNSVLVKLNAVTPGSIPAADAARFNQEMQQTSSNVAFDSLLTNLRQEAKIKYGSAAQNQ